MLIRSSLNFAAHFAAGVAFGALAAIALARVGDQALDRLRPRAAPPAREPRPEQE